ncbi:terminase [Trabulsiella odontotermitis]|uniref:Terminase n=2 Tax=Trabulsiella odontotermitis TaxID=379893 RepID=A0A0L0H453_9ENTR|nr:terminase [Trabulsiella odontotermitis]
MRFREQQQRRRKLAELSKKGAAAGAAASPDSLHIQLIELENDVAKLNALQRRIDRTAMKRDVLLPKWMPVTQRYLDSGKVFKNLVFACCIVWLFDVDELGQALQWADIAIEQGQDTPENIKRDFAHFTADAVLEWAQTIAPQGQSVEPYFSDTFERVKSAWCINEELTAKYYKFAGLQLLRAKDGKPLVKAVVDAGVLQEADSLLEQAETFYTNIGVGTMRKNIAARLRKLEQDA